MLKKVIHLINLKITLIVDKKSKKKVKIKMKFYLFQLDFLTYL